MHIKTLIITLINQLYIKNKTISFSESCTGGILSKYITNISGSSTIFKGSIISYSNDIKNKILNINKNILTTYGAVSHKTAFLMAKHSKIILNSSFNASITGMTGPINNQNPKISTGSIFCGLAYKHQIETKKINFIQKRRQYIRKHASLFILKWIIKRIHLHA